MPSITFEVSKTGTAEYFMEDEDYEVLINEYGGDVRKFIKELDIDDSYVHYYEYDINDIDYKDEEIKTGIAEYAINKNVVLDGDMKIVKELSYDLQLIRYECTQTENIIPLNIDVELALKVYKFADVNHPREELDCVVMHGNRMIATDTRMLIIAKHKVLYLEEILIPSCFCWTLDKGGGLFVDENSKACLKYNGQFYSTKDRKLARYSDVDRILPKEFNWRKIGKFTQIDFHGYDAIKFENGVVIEKKYWDMIEPFGFNSYSQLGKDTPVYFMRNGIEIMVMPLID